MRDFHTLTIARLTPEIGGAATSVTFDVPAPLAQQFTWRAGQHLTLRLWIDGQEHRRSYTISNPPGAELRITVKRVAKGIVSNHVATALSVGDRIEVMPPFGNFVLDPGASARRTHYFLAAGSGITPMYAMINACLQHEPHSVAHLVYGNANEASILFREQFDALAQTHPTRFSLRHVVSAPSVWSWFQPWRKGQVDAKAIAAVFAEAPPVAQDVHYWICGPGSMNRDLRNALMGLDVPANRIHMESFGGAGAVDTDITGQAAEVDVRLGGRTHTVPVAQNQTLLAAMRAAGLTPPFSCESGVCGACQAKLTKGQVQMRARAALSDEDIAAGLVVTCQSLAASDRLSLRFDD